MEHEGKYLEYKETVSRTYLKTVSAFANYGPGTIIFGITDDFQTVGVADPLRTALDIENQINDNIIPGPDYSLAIREDNTIALTVNKGKNTPYCYKGKAYKRNDTSTIVVSEYEYRNLLLKNMNISWTELPSKVQDLHFKAFENKFISRFGREAVFPDTYITLELYTEEEGFTNAASLLADNNPHPGLDIVEYGENRTILDNVYYLEKLSVLEILQRTQEIFERKYCYETVEGFDRVVKERIPSRCFRELIANALIHREWMVSGKIKVEMFRDKVTVSSPGGLPEGLSPERYISDRHLSFLRNRNLALTFLKLGLVETLGSGIPMIQESYRHSVRKPEFTVEDDMISTTLPVLLLPAQLTTEQRTVYELVRLMQPVSAGELARHSELSRTVQLRILNELIDCGMIAKEGKGRSTKYILHEQPMA